MPDRNPTRKNKRLYMYHSATPRHKRYGEHRILNLNTDTISSPKATTELISELLELWENVLYSLYRVAAINPEHFQTLSKLHCRIEKHFFY